MKERTSSDPHWPLNMYVWALRHAAREAPKAEDVLSSQAVGWRGRTTRSHTFESAELSNLRVQKEGRDSSDGDIPVAMCNQEESEGPV